MRSRLEEDVETAIQYRRKWRIRYAMAVVVGAVAGSLLVVISQWIGRSISY